MPADFFERIFPFTWDAVVAPLLFALLGAAAFQVLTVYRRHRNFLMRILPLRVRHLDAWPLRIDHDSIGVAYGLIPPDKLDLPYYMVEEGDVSALYQLVSLLATMYGREYVEAENHQDIQSELQRVPNLVSMSGPVWNSVTELYIGRAGSPVRFELYKDDLRLVVREPTGKSTFIESEYTPTHRPKRCYGFMLAGRVRVGRIQQRFLVLAGNSNLSTYASALFLTALYSE
jgi:hypothetical protein